MTSKKERVLMDLSIILSQMISSTIPSHLNTRPLTLMASMEKEI